MSDIQPKTDCLNRQEFIDTTVKITRELADNHKGCSFAINGKWGCGKSFILDRLEEQLSVFQDPNAAGDRYYILQYNCWQYDFYEEPSIAIVAAIQDEIIRQTKLLKEPSPALRAFFHTAAELGAAFLDNTAQKALGFGFTDISKRFMENKKNAEQQEEDNHAFDTYYGFKQKLEHVKESLRKLSEDKPIIILVDELDRCLPDYAIKVLERLHHIFSEQQNIVVILAIDQNRLEHSIKHIYGMKDDENISDYLKKFITFSLSLDIGKVSTAFWEKYKDYLSLFDVESHELDLNELATNLFSGIDARTQEKLMDRIMLLHGLTCTETYNVSVLYFELIYQVALYRRFACSFSDYIEPLLADPSDNNALRTALGAPLYRYITKLQQSIISSSRTIPTPNVGIRNPKCVIYLKNTPLAVTFTWFALIGNKRAGKGENTSPYYPLSTDKESSTLPPSVKLFVELSDRMKF